MIEVYEFEFYESEGYVIARPFDFDSSTFGDNRDDAVASAADWLALTTRYALASGDELPHPTYGNGAAHGGSVIAVAVDVSPDDIESVQAADAARMLGVSRARVTQLCQEGALFSWKRGAHVMVSVDSIEARLAESQRAGRPTVPRGLSGELTVPAKPDDAWWKNGKPRSYDVANAGNDQSLTLVDRDAA